jgi:hypothetical protein
MSSLYEDEINRLLIEKKKQLKQMEIQGSNKKQIAELKMDIKILTDDLSSFQKGLERFRIKPDNPTSNKES